MSIFLCIQSNLYIYSSIFSTRICLELWMVWTNGLDISCVGSMPLNLGRAPPISIQYPVHDWSMCSTILAVQRQTSYSSGSQHKGLRSVRGRKCGGKHAAVSTLHFTPESYPTSGASGARKLRCISELGAQWALSLLPSSHNTAQHARAEWRPVQGKQ